MSKPRITGNYLLYSNTVPALNQKQTVHTEFMKIINGGNKNEWFNNSIIDNYMSLLSKSHFLTVHYVCSSWVSQRLVQSNGKPLSFIPFYENTELFWFNCDYIIIPVNANDFHWILYVLSVSEKKIYICDSMNGSYQHITSQIIRYTAIEYFRKYGSLMNYDNFTICNYAKTTGFPIQNDGHSCGPYVCMMAKAVVYNMQFQFNAIDARNTIAGELSQQTMYRVPACNKQI